MGYFYMKATRLQLANLKRKQKPFLLATPLYWPKEVYTPPPYYYYTDGTAGPERARYKYV